LNEILAKFHGFKIFYANDFDDINIEKEKRVIINENLVSLKYNFDRLTITD
jgi:hypothetical protein